MNGGPKVWLERISKTYYGIPYEGRPLREQSVHTSRGGYVRPGSGVKQCAAQRGTGDEILSKAMYATMQDARTVLSIIRRRGERGLPVKNLYRQMYDPQFYFQA